MSSVWNQTEDKRPILSRDAHEDSSDRQELIVKIDGGSDDLQMQSGNNKVWRESSYDFWKEGHLDNGGGAEGNGSEFAFESAKTNNIPEDPPSRLISSFLQKQRTFGSEMALDIDLEMEELKKPSFSSTFISSEEKRGSLHGISDDPDDSNVESDDDSAINATKVLRCTSSSSICRSRPMLRTKAKSRLMDPPVDQMKSMRMPNRSGQIPQRSSQMSERSVLVGKPTIFEEDEDDPFEDLPENLKGKRISGWTVVELICLVLVLAALISSLGIHKLAHQSVWGLRLWKWEVLVLVLLSGRLISGCFIRFVVFFLERNFLIRKRFLYFVYGVRSAVQNCIWLGLVLLAWHFLFDKKVDSENKMLSYITKIIFCLIVATVLRLIKTLLIKVLASSFHVSTYFDRIQEALFNQYIIETLSGPSLHEIQRNLEEEKQMMAEIQKLQNAGCNIPSDLRAAAMPTKNGRVIRGSGGVVTGLKSAQIRKSMVFSSSLLIKDCSKQQSQPEGGITIDQLRKLNQKNISAWNMKRMMRIIRHLTLKTLHEQITQGFQEEEDESTMQIRSEREAKIAARKIFNNVAKPGIKYIYMVDLMRFMKEDEALKTMSLLNEMQEDRVSKSVLKNWVVNVFRERRALSLTLNDTKTAVNKLHQVANVIVGVIVIALWLLILNIATTSFFAFLSSQVLLLVFVFGNTFKTTFEAMIFLFVTHPFDVGDRCEINGVQMIVEEMNILTTIFLRHDNQKITYPNAVLATLPIGNFYRSPDMGDKVDFYIHVSTTKEKLAAMRERVIGFIEGKKEHWYPGAQVLLLDVDDMNRLKMSIWMTHRMNFQDIRTKFMRRELVVQELIGVLRELDIEFCMLPVDVNIRNMPPVVSNRLPFTWIANN